MLIAIYAGTSGDPTSLAYRCSTSNCTWPAFSSLAFCTQCANGTGQRFMRDSTMTYRSQSNITWSFDRSRAPDTSSIGATSQSNDASSVAGIRHPLLGFVQSPQVMYNSDPTFSSGPSFSGPSWAVERAIYLCINTYNLTIKRGSSSLQTLSSWDDDNGLAGLAGLDKDCSNDHVSNLLRPKIGKGTNCSASNYTITAVPLLRYFRLQLASSESSPSADLLSKLGLATNVTDTVTKIGLSMTLAMMNQGHQTLPGPAFDTEVLLHVRWPWLILPVALALSSVALLLLVMAKSSRDGMVLW